MDEIDEDWSNHFLQQTRFWIQRVLVPIVVVVGVLGNMVTVIILTRKLMRCSTNVYLTALAVADIVYLVCVFALSFKHYPNIFMHKYILYWRFIGLIHWFVDASNYTSIWLTVSFTVERWIAVCHPMRGRVLCTEARAKRVIVIVTVLCLLVTVSTCLEYTLELIDITDNSQVVCIINSHKLTTTTTTKSIISDPYDIDLLTMTETSPIIEEEITENITELFNVSSSHPLNVSLEPFELCTLSENVKVVVNSTALARNETYKNIFFYFTIVMFTCVPFILLSTFNCLLIVAVHESKAQRKTMTNTQERRSARQENRITVTLIAVVLLFIVCQSPGVAMLMYDAITMSQPKSKSTENIIYAFGNFSNFLVNLNAACNFLLYCALSDKYRRTFKTVFLGARPSSRRDTLFSSISRAASRRPTRVSEANLQVNGTSLRRNVSAYEQRRIENERSRNIVARTKSMSTPTSTENTFIT